MADFTASNDSRISVSPSGTLRIYDEYGSNTLRGYEHLSVADILALREFFAYQDGNKPHHSAQVGEVWDLDSTQGQTYRGMVVKHEDDEVPTFVTAELDYYELTDPVFTGGVKVA